MCTIEPKRLLEPSVGASPQVGTGKIHRRMHVTRPLRCAAVGATAKDDMPAFMEQLASKCLQMNTTTVCQRTAAHSDPCKPQLAWARVVLLQNWPEGSSTLHTVLEQYGTNGYEVQCLAWFGCS